MRLSTLLLTLSRFLLPPAIIGTLYLYLYPLVQQCSFPPAKRAEAACYFDGSPRSAVPAEKAPFRLLALADPQLEGDTSLPAELRGGSWFPSLRDGFWRGIENGGRERWADGVRPAVRGLLKRDAPRVLEGYRKQIDLWGNDLYLAHIYWLVSWWTAPTHMVVLGDLLGSQWISDEEFRRRSERFWKKVFRGTEKVGREVMDVSGRVEVLGQDERWRKRLIAVAGNHDIGYAGDINQGRIERFEEAYGRVNWEIRFRLNSSSSSSAEEGSPSFFASGLSKPPPELRLIVLNSMNLDNPAYDPKPRQQSLDFLSSALHEPDTPNTLGTVLLTHIPLHKEAGVCVDAPFFSYFPSNQGGGIKEQNHISSAMSQNILDGLVPNAGYGVDGKPRSVGNAIVLNGHDHEGCDTYHYRLSDSFVDTHLADTESEQLVWNAGKFRHSLPHRNDESWEGVREVTVRSMMGSYGGNAGLLSAWWEADKGGGDGGGEDGAGGGRWRFEYSTCMLGVQHIWWGVHILDLIVVGMGVVGLALEVGEVIDEIRRENREAEEGKKRA